VSKVTSITIMAANVSLCYYGTPCVVVQYVSSNAL